MFELGSVASLDIAERRIGIDQTNVDQISETQHVFCFTKTIQESRTKRQRTKMFVNGR
jgi:hypothetical protein